MFLPFLSIAQSTEEQLFEQATSYYNAKEYEKAYPLYLEQANNGNAEAQCFMGHYYYFGYAPMEKNYAEAYCWYLKSSRQGNKIALNNLGAMYENGEYVMQDYEKAYQYYMNAVERGNAFSAKNIGRLFLNHYISPELECPEEMAEKWYKQAAIMDNSDGNLWLAEFYGSISSLILDGIKHCRKYPPYDMDVLNSVRLIEDSLIDIAAKNGSRGAQLRKGEKYFFEEKYDEALYWIALANKQGAEYVYLLDDNYPVYLAFVLINFLKKNHNIHYYQASMGGSTIPRDENGTILIDKGYFEFLIRDGSGLVGSIRLSLHGNVLAKHPAIHEAGWCGEDNMSFDFLDEGGGIAPGL